jgi:glucose-1-phosphate adenylyltransferase
VLWICRERLGVKLVESKHLKETLTLVLAGGQGERLYPLTRDRAKPAVPFGGQYRIIDFTLSNCVNSGLRQVYVLTQYMSHSLDRHLKLAWNFFVAAFDEFLLSVHPQFKTKDSWYLGTADAVFQNTHLLLERRPKRVLILSGDHIYRMDYAEMIAAHIQSGAAATVAAVECDLRSASRMGVLDTGSGNRVLRYWEKPENPRPVHNQPDRALVNMGVYIFDTPMLLDVLYQDALRRSSHDFGRDILPCLVEKGQVYVHRFYDQNRQSYNYWRDIGTLDSYYEASMDLVSAHPPFSLHECSFPTHSFAEVNPPARLLASSGLPGRKAIGHNSLICNGCTIRGGRVERSVLSPNVRVNSHALVEDSILFEGVEIGSHAKIRRAILDKDVRIPPRFHVGYDLDEDKKRFTVTESGIVVIPKREPIKMANTLSPRSMPQAVQIA